ncbi:hypothetical protein [Algoriphagus sp. PAP.12]|uniref:hypothetical protein n=1 Tax=Algoriphagus sp. PAP.12 TaxID=2996678 RepID=UPI00227B424C|nr:hypothetical protein [Algoriphagus sp. PAP.12]
MRICFRLTLFFLFFSGGLSAQQAVLHLRPVLKPRYETNYRIVDVLDFRGISEKSIGDIYYTKRDKAPVVFEKELSELILKRFQSDISFPDSIARDIQVRLEMLNVWERPNAKTGLYDGRMEIRLSFYLLTDLDPIYLVKYQNRILYQRSLNGVNKMQDLMVEYIDESLEYFDNWIKTNGLEHRDLAETVELRMKDPVRPSTIDTVFYDPEFPLYWENFSAKPNLLSRKNAVINTSFSIEGSAVLQQGNIIQTLEFKVYMLPNQSWVKEPDDYALNHERRHFDIVRIVVDRLKTRLHTMELTPDNFQAKLNEVFFDSYREMNKIQEAYDGQSANGMNKEMQVLWDCWIQEGLSGDWTYLIEAIEK